MSRDLDIESRSILEIVIYFMMQLLGGTINGGRSCPTRYLNSQQFESLVINKIKEHVLTTENLTWLVYIVNEEMDSLALEYRQRLDSFIDEIADVDRRLERLYDALKTGKIQLADLAPRIQQLRRRQE